MQLKAKIIDALKEAIYDIERTKNIKDLAFLIQSITRKWQHLQKHVQKETMDYRRDNNDWW